MSVFEMGVNRLISDANDRSQASCDHSVLVRKPWCSATPSAAPNCRASAPLAVEGDGGSVARRRSKKERDAPSPCLCDTPHTYPYPRHITIARQGCSACVPPAVFSDEPEIANSDARRNRDCPRHLWHPSSTQPPRKLWRWLLRTARDPGGNQQSTRSIGMNRSVAPGGALAG